MHFGKPGAVVPLRVPAASQGSGEGDEVRLRRVLYGIPWRNDEAAAERSPGHWMVQFLGLARLRAGECGRAQGVSGVRSFREDIVALFPDGKG